MGSYTEKLNYRVIYSVGDAHSQGRRIARVLLKIREKAVEAKEDAGFIQLGDLCDGFSLPDDSSNEALRADIRRRMFDVPAFGCAVSSATRLVNWHKHETDREGDVVGIVSAAQLLEHSDHDEMIALYEASRSFETLDCFMKLQSDTNNHFHVIIGNHDADLLRGRARYGRQQKYLLLGLLGFSPDEVIAHMTQGTPDVLLRHPYLAWLNTRPHMAISRDTIYMHGGPTTTISERMATQGAQGFADWIDELDQARSPQWDHAAFREHESFLSPDNAENDWLTAPERLSAFCDAANKTYLAVGHSPFLDFPKGPLLDLKRSPHAPLFHTPALLPPNGRLVKHDTNLKRTGDLWVCRHDCESSVWSAFDESLRESPLRQWTPQKMPPVLPAP